MTVHRDSYKQAQPCPQAIPYSQLLNSLISSTQWLSTSFLPLCVSIQCYISQLHKTIMTSPTPRLMCLTKFPGHPHSSFWYWHTANDQKPKVGMGARWKRSGNETERSGNETERSGNEATLQHFNRYMYTRYAKPSRNQYISYFTIVIPSGCSMAIFGT